MLPVSDPIPIDTEISRNEGTSVAIEATSESLPAPRIAQTPSLFEMIEQRNKENDRLRHKLAYQRTKQGAELHLLQQALIEYHKLQSSIDYDFSVNR
jgi:hypothetical protein